VNETRRHLLDAAEALVRRRGYAAFSYADLAEAVGVSKPTIHHHFPTKEDLCVALIAAYAEAFDQRLSAIWAGTPTGRGRIQAYADLYLEGLREGQACLCAMLASDHASVPDRIRVGVADFMQRNLRWLADVIADAAATGEFAAGLAPQAEAQALYAALLGAMFTARSLGRLDVFEAVATRSAERLERGAD
jgi:TetR/AcrR family transcriptional repressor of nem operon